MSAERQSARVVRAALMALLSASCASEQPSDADTSSAALATVTEATTSSFAVAVTDASHSYGCSGVLVGPHLVLTARHCVDGRSASIVDCATTKFTTTTADRGIRITQCPDTSSPSCEWHASTGIVRPSDDAFCGNDLAALIIQDPLPGPYATPTRDVAAESLPYAVLGFGGVDASGAGGGIRRLLRNQLAACAEGGAGTLPDCTTASEALLLEGAIVKGELYSAPGICPGDSGGPLFVDATLGSEPTVFALVSREVVAGDACPPAIATPLSAFGATLETAASRASAIDGSPVPDWAISSPPLIAEGGCAVRPGGARRDGAHATISAAMLFLAWRRRTRVRRNGALGGLREREPQRGGQE